MRKILFEDNHLLIAVKPCEMATQPTPQDSTSLENDLKHYIKETYQKKAGIFLHAIHRLDKQASGIVVFAKSQKALSRLNESIRKKACKKLYLAAVQGTFVHKEGTLEHYLVHANYRAVADPSHPEAKKCHLYYKVLQENSGKTLLEVLLDTGRYHQIRCQLATIGHPILGDVKYGSTVPFPKGIALHHHHLEIEHPTKKELLTFESSPDWVVDKQLLCF